MVIRCFRRKMASTDGNLSILYARNPEDSSFQSRNEDTYNFSKLEVVKCGWEPELDLGQLSSERQHTVPAAGEVLSIGDVQRYRHNFKNDSCLLVFIIANSSSPHGVNTMALIHHFMTLSEMGEAIRPVVIIAISPYTADMGGEADIKAGPHTAVLRVWSRRPIEEVVRELCAELTASCKEGRTTRQALRHVMKHLRDRRLAGGSLVTNLPRRLYLGFWESFSRYTQPAKPKTSNFGTQSVRRIGDQLNDDLMEVPGVSDFGIARDNVIVMNCDPAEKDVAEPMIRDIVARNGDVKVFVIWQKIRIIAAVQGIPGVTASFWHLDVKGLGEGDGPWCSLGLPVTVDGAPHQLTSFHPIMDLRYRVAQQADNPQIVDEEMRMTEDERTYKIDVTLLGEERYYVACRDFEAPLRLGNQSKGALRHVKGKNAVSQGVTGDAAFVKTSEFAPEVDTRFPMGVARRFATKEEVNNLWLSPVAKAGPATGETRGNVIYTQHRFRMNSTSLRNIWLTNALVVGDDGDMPFAQRGDSGSPVRVRGQGGEEVLVVGAVTAVSDEAAFPDGVYYMRTAEQGELRRADRHGDLASTPTVTFVLPYYSQKALLETEFGVQIALKQP